MTSNMSETFVIVGASLAGAKAAETLREEGFDGHVVLLGAEPHRPYERPPLSKDYLRGEAERDAAFVHEEGFYAEQDIDLRMNAVVIGAGWIGSEVAASARTKGMDVTLIEQLSVPLERVIGPEVGEIYADIHRDHGTDFLGGAGVEAIEGDGRAERVRLKGGKTLD